MSDQELTGTILDDLERRGNSYVLALAKARDVRKETVTELIFLSLRLRTSGTCQRNSRP